MAMGRCAWMTCESMLGTAFRAAARVILADMREFTAPIEVQICPGHERILEAAKKRGDQIRMSAEELLYLESWMVAPLFTVWG